MDDYIPPGGFFTPKRPSFRMTAGPQQQMPPQTPHNFNVHRSFFNTPPGSYQNRGQYMTPPFEDHRHYHQQNPRNYYLDRFGRMHENAIPVYFSNGHDRGFGYGGQQGYKNQNGVYYGPFHHGVFTFPPPNRGKGDRRKNWKECEVDNESESVVTSPTNLIHAARLGFQNFQKDYLEEKARLDEKVKETTMWSNVELPFKTLPPVLHQFDFANIRFDVDDRDFVDKRPIASFVHDDEKQYKLFEDQTNQMRDIIKDIYNVNDIDHQNLNEMCGVKVLPETLKKWPLSVIGSNWPSVRKRVVNFSCCKFGKCVTRNGDRRCSGGCQWEEIGPGNYGVGSLAKLFFEDVADFPSRHSTFVGMNIDKLVKGLDSSKPVTPSFAGPLADRNHSYDFGWMEVTVGFKEYDLPFEPDDEDVWVRSLEAYEWSRRRRITRLMFTNFSFEILLYIFYTITVDALQLIAAKEMYIRGWRYHKIYQVWITPWVSSGEGESGITEDGEWVSGIYKYFDYSKWEFQKSEFKVNAYLLEGEPVEVKDALWE